MAASLQPDMPFPLLLDPEHSLRTELGTGKLSIRQMMSLRSAANYSRVLGGIRRAAVEMGEAANTPGVVVLDAEQRVSWLWIGEAVGDYPPIDAIIGHLPSN